MTPDISDALDSLPDRLLNEIYAVEVAESHQLLPPRENGRDGQRNYRRKCDGAFLRVEDSPASTMGPGEWPAICGLAELVEVELGRHPLSVIERCSLEGVAASRQPWRVILGNSDGTSVAGQDPSRNRAAVMALIRARRAFGRIGPASA